MAASVSRGQVGEAPSQGPGWIVVRANARGPAASQRRRKNQPRTGASGPGTAPSTVLYEQTERLVAGLAICQSTIESQGRRLSARANAPSGVAFQFTSTARRPQEKALFSASGFQSVRKRDTLVLAEFGDYQSNRCLPAARWAAGIPTPTPRERKQVVSIMPAS